MMKMTLMLLAIFLLAGCSNKAIYDNIQSHNRKECSRLPQSQYEKCMEDTEKSFAEYERERKETLDKEP
jgi:outer membrane murein-binding lipoprotein Lpp